MPDPRRDGAAPPPAPPSRPVADLDEPLKTLAACHDRDRRQCAVLRALVQQLAADGADIAVRQPAQAVVAHFDWSLPAHRTDEEEALMPALIESMAGSDPVCLRELAAALSAQHRDLERLWRSLRRALAQRARGEPAELAAREVLAFADLLEDHLAREDREVLPMAQRLLSPDDLGRIDLAMRARRGAADREKYPPLPWD